MKKLFSFIRFKSIFGLFVLLTLLITSTLYLPSSFAQDSPQWHLPEGATARLGKGWLYDIQYSPDGTQLAAAGTLGVWMYDTATHEETALFTGYGYGVAALAYAPDGSTLAAGFLNGTVRLWDPETGMSYMPSQNTDEASALSLLALMGLCSPVAVETILSTSGTLKQENS